MQQIFAPKSIFAKLTVTILGVTLTYITVLLQALSDGKTCNGLLVHALRSKKSFIMPKLTNINSTALDLNVAF